MSDSTILYLDSPGKENTDRVIEAVIERLKRMDIRHVVVASDTGETGKKVLDRLKGMKVEVVVVTSHYGFDKEGECAMSPEAENELRSAGAKLVRASHVLSGVERSISKKLGGASRVEMIAETLRALFGQGLKVAVEITVMAADSGAIPCGPDVQVISIGGTESGADTACVVRPAHANSFFNFRVKEIIALPRGR
ncbi:MAG TPA: pyruvate kinase alpha/beta domain-containing protein [Thermoplasmata archaeon]